ncbi:MAG: metallophosphoesterase [Alphaproteobacteria bacterium]|nr:metallophosphoesterase [Alphaproteobacteria bacterium]
MKIAHLSDLHFGTEKQALVQALLQVLNDLRPDLVVISGDFTQHGMPHEFQRAHQFLNQIPCRTLCVPGNHDIPRYNLYDRFFRPYHSYRRWISPSLYPVIAARDLKIVGINSARPILPHWNWAYGAVSGSQLDWLDYQFRQAATPINDIAFRLCVLHHPIQKAPEFPLAVKVFGARQALAKIQDLKIDLVLTGHVHHAAITTIDNTVYVSASTTLSHRTRTQENGFNVIVIDEDFFDVQHFRYGRNQFEEVFQSRHARHLHP